MTDPLFGQQKDGQKLRHHSKVRITQTLFLSVSAGLNLKNQSQALRLGLGFWFSDRSSRAEVKKTSRFLNFSRVGEGSNLLPRHSKLDLESKNKKNSQIILGVMAMSRHHSYGLKDNASQMLGG